MEGPLGETPPSLPGKGSRRAWRSLNPASWGLQLATVGSEDTTQDVKGLGTPGLRGAGVRVGTLMGNTRRRGKLGLEQAPLRSRVPLNHQAGPSLGPSPRGPAVPALGGRRASCAGNLRRWPSTRQPSWLGSKLCHARILFSSPHSWAEAQKQRPCPQDGAQGSVSLLTIAPWAQSTHLQGAGDAGLARSSGPP